MHATTKATKAVALLVFDGRQGLPGPEELMNGESYPEHTIVELPFQRELVRKTARSQNFEITREIIIEIDNERSIPTISDEIARQAAATGCDIVITAADDLLRTTGLSKLLDKEFATQRQQLVSA